MPSTRPEARVVRCDDHKVLSIVRDITERRRAELQARQLRDELAHVGRVTTLAALTGSLAHEINQPLAAIMTNAQAARRLIGAPVPDLDELRAALTDIVADNQRAADVVRRLRTLLRKDTSEDAPVDINDSIGEVIKASCRATSSPDASGSKWISLQTCRRSSAIAFSCNRSRSIC